MTMIWLRLYLTLEVLGFLFGVDKATVSRYTTRICHFRTVGEETLGWTKPPKRGQGMNLTKARAAYPDLFAFVDATEQPFSVPVIRKSRRNTTQARRSGIRAKHKWW